MSSTCPDDDDDDDDKEDDDGEITAVIIMSCSSLGTSVHLLHQGLPIVTLFFFFSRNTRSSLRAKSYRSLIGHVRTESHTFGLDGMATEQIEWNGRGVDIHLVD